MEHDLFAAFKDPEMARGVVRRLHALASPRPVKLMHVCGTHENAIAHHGLRDLLPDWLQVIAGPGCPVCVCPAADIQMAVDLALSGKACVATFGDMFRVPARTSLAEAKAAGGDVRIVFSITDAVELARANPSLEVVFFAVGFETTAVTTAAAVLSDPPANFRLLVSHRSIPAALAALLADPELVLAGFLLPGHVTTVTGTLDYQFIPERHGVPVTVAGFEPVDVLLGILSLAEMAVSGVARLENRYTRAVRGGGNERAVAALRKVFSPCDAHWRGIGVIPGSGLALRPEFARLDAGAHFGFVPDTSLHELAPGCSCGLIMLGKLDPPACPLFGRACTLDRPYGPCMVSMEGTCRNWHRYRG